MISAVYLCGAEGSDHVLHLILFLDLHLAAAVAGVSSELRYCFVVFSVVCGLVVLLLPGWYWLSLQWLVLVFV